MRRTRAWSYTRDGLVARARGAAHHPLAVCCGLLFALLVLVAGAPSARAAALPTGPRPPGGNYADPVIRAVDIAEPAVVRIGTDEHATLTLQLCSRSITLPPGGGTYDVASTGSGAFISSSGDILTADHVVHPPDDEVLYFAADDVAYVLDNLSQFDPACGLSGGAVSASDVADGLVQLKYTTHASGLRSVVWLSTAYSGPIDASSLKTAPALDATVEAYSAYSQDDLAVLHVALSDTPSVPVGRSTDVAVEDILTVIGFPGNGDVTDSPSNMLTPSVNSVSVSALKENDNGSPLIQVSGNVEHGDSGGPLLNAQGQVVGVVSFGGADPQGVTSFMRATSSAQPLIASQHISTAPGHFQVAWTQAFEDYAATYPGHWHVAQAKMEALAAAYPQFKGLYPYLTFARSAAAQEQTQQSSLLLPTATLVILGGAAVVVVLLLALALIFILRARAKRAARAAPQKQPGYAQTYPGNAPPGYGPQPGQMYPPFPAPPYASAYGMAQRPAGTAGGQVPGGAPVEVYRAPVPAQGAGAPSGAGTIPPGQGWQDRRWGQPAATNESATAGATPPAPPAPRSPWDAPQPSPRSDAYNTNGGVDASGNRGY